MYLLLLWKYNSKPGSGDGYSKAPLAFLFSFVPGIIFGAIYSAATIKDPEGVKRNPALWDSLQARMHRLALRPLAHRAGTLDSAAASRPGLPSRAATPEPPPPCEPPLPPLQGFNMGEGMYKTFLGVNVVGHIVCLAGTVIGFLLHQYVPALQLGGGAAWSECWLGVELHSSPPWPSPWPSPWPPGGRLSLGS